MPQQQTFSNVQPVPPPSVSQSFTDVTPISAGKSASDDTGIWAGIKRNTVGMVSGLYHAFADPATDDEKSALLADLRQKNKNRILGPEAPETLATNPSAGTLGMYRILAKPGEVLNAKSDKELAAARTMLDNGEHFKAANMSVSGAADKVLSKIPLVGPFINSVAERGEGGLIPASDPQGKNIPISQVPPQNRDFSGAATDVASALVAEHAKAAAGKISDTIAPAQQFLAEKAVAPLVKKPVGATLEDARFNRNPAKAIVNEGLMGTKDQMVEQATQKISDISADTDAKLQNHPNANMPIDVGPVIDQAIADAKAAARKVGNKAAVSRLADLHDALSTEYGPTKGTPLEMNNLKREIGNAAESLGAFKHADPLESSAAAALSDVYTEIKNKVNEAVPDVAPNNERVADLLSARMGLKRNIALETNKSILSGLTVTNLPFKALEKTAGSAPVRSAAAQILKPAAVASPITGGTLASPESLFRRSTDAPAIKMSTDSLGIRWAESPDGYRVSIPKSISAADAEAYAKPKLEEQAQIHGNMKVGI